MLTPHVHVLLPEGMWTGTGEWVAVPPPSEVEVLRNMGLLPRPCADAPRPGHSPPQLRLAV